MNAPPENRDSITADYLLDSHLKNVAPEPSLKISRSFRIVKNTESNYWYIEVRLGPMRFQRPNFLVRDREGSSNTGCLLGTRQETLASAF
jgi:hypothetical protein